MKSEWLHHTILRVASLLVPGDERAAWVKEWQSELWYIPRRGATIFCLGAFRDALWLKRNNLNLVKRTRIHLESPLTCLVFLATLAAVSIMIAVCLPAPDALTPSSHLRARDLPTGCIPMLFLSCLYLPIIRLATVRTPANYHLLPWPGRLRRGIFLALKIALVQPIMLCGFVAMLAIGTVPIVPLAIGAAWILTFRWVLIDQRRRCPVCLRLLTDPVRIGSPSRTFLEWYGAESTCPRGHGLMHVQEIPASDTGTELWLYLDDSWSSLFAESVGQRRS